MDLTNSNLDEDTLDRDIEHLRGKRGNQINYLSSITQFMNFKSFDEDEQEIIPTDLPENNISSDTITKCSLKQMQGNIHTILLPVIKTQELIQAQNCPELVINFLRSQNNLLRFTVATFLTKSQFMLTAVEHVISKYTSAVNQQLKVYIELKV